MGLAVLGCYDTIVASQLGTHVLFLFFASVPSANIQKVSNLPRIGLEDFLFLARYGGDAAQSKGKIYQLTEKIYFCPHSLIFNDE